MTAHHRPLKRTGIAYLLWLPLGLLGVHQFYLGRPGRGALYLFTLGLFTVGWMWDGFTLPTQVRRINVRGY